MKAYLCLRGVLYSKIKQTINIPIGIYKPPITSFLILLCFVFAAKAQEVEVHSTPVAEAEIITGTVYSVEGNVPLEGATLKIKGTNITTITNANGEFRILRPLKDGIIIASFLGYTSQKIPFTDKTRNLLITLERTVGMLEEVQINTGYQHIPKERATGSFSQPDKVMFENRVSTDVISRLDGITSGLVFNAQGTMASNDNSILNVRGLSTIHANNQPLIVVDNFPYDGDINDINPNDVESVTVLKDAAASSIWGVRAGNGVIVITTKKGKLNKPLNISFNANATIFERPDLKYDLNFINSTDFIDLEAFLFEKGYYNGKLSDQTFPVISPVVALLAQQRDGQLTNQEVNEQLSKLREIDVRDDLQKYFYRNAINQQYALSFSGGSDRNAYYVSLGYDKILHKEIKKDNDRITLNLDNTFLPFPKLSIQGGANIVQSNNRSNNALSNTNKAFLGGIYPYAQLAGSFGESLPIIKDHAQFYTDNLEERGFLNGKFYPLDEFDSGAYTVENTSNEVRLYSAVAYEILKGLRANVKYQYQLNHANNSTLAKRESYYARNEINKFSMLDDDKNVIGYHLPVGSIWMRGSGINHSQNIRGQLDYNYQSGSHALTAILGIEAREFRSNSESSYLYGYNEDTGSVGVVDHVTMFPMHPNRYGYIPDGLGVGGTVDRFRSYFSNTAYTFQNKYTFSLSGRIDQSNFLGVKTNLRSVPLWSTGIKWDISKEGFYTSQLLPYLTMRGSYGFSGNLDKSTTAVTTFRSGYTAELTNAPYASISNYGNEQLRWEKTGMLNFGLDFGFANRVVTGSVDYFFRSGNDLMGDEIMPPSSGLMSFRGNYASMKGHGIDLNLHAKLMDRMVKWQSAFLFSWATDKITKYTAQSLPSQLAGSGTGMSPVVGRPVYSMYSFAWAGLDEIGDPLGYDSGNQVSKDYNQLSMPQNMNELIYHGPARPIFFGGLRNTLNYRKFELSVNLSYKLGHYFRRKSIGYSNLFRSYNYHVDYSSRWQNPGDEYRTNVPSLAYPANSSRDSFYERSEVLVEKADHIRLQDLSLAYNFEQSNLAESPFRSFQLFLYINNLGVLWKATKANLDPDFPVGGIPSLRSYAFGIKVNL